MGCAVVIVLVSPRWCGGRGALSIGWSWKERFIYTAGAGGCEYRDREGLVNNGDDGIRRGSERLDQGH